MPHIRFDITFIGRVQGVGFRYATQRAAQPYAVTGWVRNEPDGSVRCLAEGEAAELERFVKAIRDAMATNIRDITMRREEATGEFADFTIRK